MTVRGKLLLAVVTVFTLAALIITVVVILARSVDNASGELGRAEALFADALEINLLRSRYLSDRDERSAQQWLALQEKVAKSLKDLSWAHAGDRDLIEKIPASHEARAQLAKRLVDNYRENLRAGAERAPGAELVEKRLLDELLVNAQEVNNWTRELFSTAQARLNDAFSAAVITTLVGISALALVVAAFSFVVSRTVLRSIGKLREGTDAVAAGDLYHRVDIRGGGEFGELAAGFNDMTVELGASRERLDEYSRELEAMVEERTGELESANRELRRSNEELEQFAYIASHDLQEPLRTLTGFSQLLEKRYGGRLDEEAGEFLDFIVEAAARMNNLINDLLAFSRVETRARTHASVDMNDVVERVRSALGVSIEENDASLRAGRLPVVSADQTQMVQLVQNLVSNAIKFRSDRKPEIEVKAERAGDEWVFSVSDNGVGMDTRYADRAFRIFQRLTPRGEHTGTGIGLAISKRIIERHGGRIWVESEPGEGATFYFTLPVERRP